MVKKESEQEMECDMEWTIALSGGGERGFFSSCFSAWQTVEAYGPNLRGMRVRERPKTTNIVGGS